MRRHALRLLVALLTFTCGVSAPLVRLQLGRLATAAPVQEQLTDTAPCFPTNAPNSTDSALCTHAYFPAAQFGLRYSGPTNAVQSYQLTDYSGLLALMNEPSLLAFKDCEGEAYRFLWPRRLAAPLAIRVWRVGDRQFLAVKQLGTEPAYWVEGLILDGSVQETVRPLSAEEWTRFIVLLNEAAYWSQPPGEERNALPSMWSLQDADRVLEGVKDCRYYIVDRYAPGGDIRLACRYLLKLSGLNVPPESVNFDYSHIPALLSETKTH